MKKILIINPPIRLTDKPRHIPHGLAILANVIRKKIGIKPYFLDLNAFRYDDKQVESILSSISFDFVLIGGLIPVYRRIILLSKLIKDRNPSAVIIAGGSAAMSVPEILLQNSEVDIVCAGEGEKVMVELLEALANDSLSDVKNVKGFYFKINGEIVFSGESDLLMNLDEESSIPAYDLLPMDIYLSNPCVGIGRDIDFITSRGCPFQCTFCYQPWGQKFRAHSVDFIIDTIRHLKNKYNIDFISFLDDEFIAKKQRVYEFCEKRNRYFPDLLWSCTGRVNLINEDITKCMRESGCVAVQYGFESGSEEILKSMKKGVTLQQMEKAIDLGRKHGLLIPASFIIGMPGETDKTCKETVNFCCKNNISLNSLMFATPYPGTELFEYALRKGIIDKNKIHEFVMGLEDARDFTVNLTDYFSDEELVEKRLEMIVDVDSSIKKLSFNALNQKRSALFGSLAGSFMSQSEEDMVHRSKHGGLDCF